MSLQLRVAGQDRYWKMAEITITTKRLQELRKCMDNAKTLESLRFFLERLDPSDSERFADRIDKFSEFLKEIASDEVELYQMYMEEASR